LSVVGRAEEINSAAFQIPTLSRSVEATGKSIVNIYIQSNPNGGFTALQRQRVSVVYLDLSAWRTIAYQSSMQVYTLTNTPEAIAGPPVSVDGLLAYSRVRVW
jgi:hypothetical protein